MRLGPTCRNQPDQFVVLPFVFDGVNDDDQADAAHHASRSEPSLTDRELVFDRIVQRVAEDLRRSFEGDAMLVEVGPRLVVVSLELHASPPRVRGRM
jgi:hypothetical protein